MLCFNVIRCVRYIFYPTNFNVLSFNVLLNDCIKVSMKWVTCNVKSTFPFFSFIFRYIVRIIYRKEYPCKPCLQIPLSSFISWGSFLKRGALGIRFYPRFQDEGRLSFHVLLSWLISCSLHNERSYFWNTFQRWWETQIFASEVYLAP